MSQENVEAMLRAVHERPDDDAVRTPLGGVLEDRGDADDYTNILRLQHELRHPETPLTEEKRLELEREIALEITKHPAYTNEFVRSWDDWIVEKDEQVRLALGNDAEIGEHPSYTVYFDRVAGQPQLFIDRACAERHTTALAKVWPYTNGMEPHVENLQPDVHFTDPVDRLVGMSLPLFAYRLSMDLVDSHIAAHPADEHIGNNSKAMKALLDRAMAVRVISAIHAEDPKMLDMVMETHPINREVVKDIFRYLDLRYASDSMLSLFVEHAKHTDAGVDDWVREKISKVIASSDVDSDRCVKALLDLGMDVDKERFGNTVLQECIRSKNPRKFQIAKQLMEFHPNLDVKTQTGETPLHWLAADEGKDAHALMKLLIDNGANVNAVNGKGETLLHTILEESVFAPNALARLREKAKLLIQGGASVHAVDKKGESVLQIAKLYRSGLSPLFEEAAETEAKGESPKKQHGGR